MAEGISVFRGMLLMFIFVYSFRVMQGISTTDYRDPYGTKLVGFRAIGESFGSQYDITIKRAEVLVLAGDVLPRPPLGDNTPQSWYVEQYEKLDEWLGKLAAEKSFDHRVVIWGDHDVPKKCVSCNESFPNYNKHTIPRLRNAHVLFDESITIEGLVIYGVSWQTQNPGGAFYLPRGSKVVLEKWNLIPETSDVIVSHCPPYGMGDGTKKGKDYKVLPDGNITDALLGYEQAFMTIAGLQLNETDKADVVLSESVMKIAEKVEKNILKHQLKKTEVATNRIEKTRRMLQQTMGDGLLKHVMDSRKTRLLITSQIAVGHGVARHFGIPVINPSFTNNAAASSQFANMMFYPKMPVFWSLYGPQEYYPQKDGNDVPFIIE